MWRPHLRDYEIAFGANSSMPLDKVICVSDIMLSIKHGKLFLRSKRLNKEIIPHSTSAYNFYLSKIPTYRFLCDMQNQGKRSGISFDLGYLQDELPYIPRIRYKNTILFPATWNIQVDEIKHLISIKEDKNLLHETSIWRNEKKILNYSLLSDYDNELFINWNNVNSIRSFLSIVKNRINFRLIEFLYTKKDIVIKDEEGNVYLNECIATLFKNEE